MLKHIPLEDTYFNTKDFEIHEYESTYSAVKNTPHGIVLFNFNDGFYTPELEENGMEKFVLMLSSALFEINDNALVTDMAVTVSALIAEFETGRFDDLFTADELAAIYADITTVKEYIAAHPELLAD